MVASRTDPKLREHFSRSMEKYEKDILQRQEGFFPQSQLANYVFGCFIRGLCLERLVNPPELIEQIFEEFVRLMEIALANQDTAPIARPKEK